MLSSTLTQKGQVTIPVNLRHRLHLEAGDKIEFDIQDDKIIITKQKDDITASFGLLHPKSSASLTDIQSAIEQGSDE